MTGSEIGDELLPLSGAAREAAILAHLQAGHIPSFLKNTRVPVTIRGKGTDGIAHTLVIGVSPDVLSLGDDGDYLRIPLTPMTFEAWSRGKHLLPTRKLARDIFRNAAYKIEPQPMTNNETTALYIQSNEAINKSIKAIPGFNKRDLLVSPKKDVVYGPNLDGSRVAIFGWFHKAGKGEDSSADRWQPYSTIHTANYVDYSHGLRLIDRDAVLDGDTVDLHDVFLDKTLWPLVSDQGAFAAVFPNKGKGGGGTSYEPPKGPPATPPSPPKEEPPSEGSPLAVAGVIATAGYLVYRFLFRK